MDKIKLLDKPLRDLTMRDHLKVNGVAFAVTAGVAALYVGAITLKEHRDSRRWNQRNVEFQETIEEV